MNPGVRRLAARARTPLPGASSFIATVTAINGQTVDLDTGQRAVRHLSSYWPVIGDEVFVAGADSTLVVIDSLVRSVVSEELTIDPATNWENFGAPWTPLTVVKHGSVVTVNGLIGTTAVPANPTTLTILPEEFRPSEAFMFSTHPSATGTAIRWDIYPSGSFIIRHGSTAGFVPIHGVWPALDA